ncbi:hypothetical protein AtNW77_Chr4g0319271 [Arabidopsis thaliana]|uniref:At4g39360 n=4 Tax=Arabidopsis TaxID=3701 RepID=Q5Q0B1_ARATH|nr:uncharacterized protein AT4G39360 [Arabidopsis thaliana]KAG7618979.1 hypothetical protein ISN45_At04g041740 [Arabidopsis thaliana x Arabidopsis arenosa]AAV68876.1 hypothetical protein AT4G39360 [Arabidopsis thaliana]AAX23907.1 hypothetical protein At4g39360 [Arabidopsis thaliana]ABR46220.1 At4g39360 [Arabidopsis thaliana]AEE87060.1 hypothetical protein AT4G39360 [Arabidopsis thaliana]|eukprot:NP_195646.2 hypothetical protein AT4G39360 [Arabidopsis thaliana]
MINQMEKICFSEDSGVTFSETEIEAAEQLVQLSEEDTLSCSSGTGCSVSTGYDGCDGKGSEGNNTNIQDDVVSSKVRDHMAEEAQNDGVWRIKNVTNGQSFLKAMMETRTGIHKKKKFRSLESIYRATNEMTRD